MDATQHALNCGTNLTGKVAMPLEDSAGHLLMVDITDPVTLKVLINSGTTMDCQLIEVCQDHGIDYVVVYAGWHKPRQ